jgi:phosphatidylserine/phosphatidylglycerophosphate/cardiolipin synthase-like enzyme
MHTGAHRGLPHPHPRLRRRLLSAGIALLALLAASAARVLAKEEPQLPPVEATHDNQVEAIFGLPAFVQRVEADIASARRQVLVDFYVLGGESGSRIARALALRHGEGLDVRVLLDEHMGSIPRIKDEARAVRLVLDAAGVPVRMAAMRRGGRPLHARTEDHNKLVAIDGRVGYVGGTNPTDRFLRYNDLMMRTAGPAVRALAQLFEYDWRSSERPPAPRPAADQDHDIEFAGSGLLAGASRPGLSTMRVLSTGIGRRTFEGAVVNAIRSARESILVQQHHFAHDPLIDELAAARRRGVDVKVLLDPTNIDNFIPLFHRGPRAIFNAHAAVRLEKAGVDVRFIRLEDGVEAYHMKLGVFDRSVLLVGSANWERIGCRTSTETVLEIAGGPVVGEIAGSFDELWRSHAERRRVGYASRLLNFLLHLYF